MSLTYAKLQNHKARFHRPPYHELALDVGISNSLATILHTNQHPGSERTEGGDQMGWARVAYTFHQADVARGVLYEERPHAPAAADAARPLPFRLRITHHLDFRRSRKLPQEPPPPSCSSSGSVLRLSASNHPTGPARSLRLMPSCAWTAGQRRRCRRALGTRMDWSGPDPNPTIPTQILQPAVHMGLGLTPFR